MSNIFLLLLLVVLATLVPYLMSKERKQHESEKTWSGCLETIGEYYRVRYLSTAMSCLE